MNRLTVHFRIATPMFIAGADPKKAEIRAPSIKGALRFWYRVLYPQGDREEEFRIFGGADKGMGQSCVLLRLHQRSMHPHEGRSGDQRWLDSNIAYLGYGVIGREATERPYLKEGSRFALEILFRPRAGETEEAYNAMRRKVQRSLWAFIMLGGIGARSRKGFGSLAVEKIEGIDGGLPDLMHQKRDALLYALRAFFESLSTDAFAGHNYPEFTCFSTQSRWLVTQVRGTAIEALEWLGDTIHKYRSYRGDSTRKWASEDHNLMLDWVTDGSNPPSVPKRAAFGLPHNYFFSSVRRKGEINLMEGNKKGRRASPLLFHIHEFTPLAGQQPQACVVANFLPARLIPRDQKVRFSTDNESETYTRRIPDDFSAITDLLTRIADDGGSEGVQNHVTV